MSEPAGKKKKVLGWEEAGFEFYQESYNSEDGYLKNSPPITTLLPSKQNRFGTCKRPSNRAYDNRTQKYRQTPASTVQGTQLHNEINFSALPDLSQILTDEERIWEEMLLIKLMPVPMSQKKSFKASLQNTTKLRLQGFNQFKWKHRKAWQKLSLRCSEWITKLELWHSSLKHIGGHFGTGVVAYFLFLRWLFFLNLLTFFLIFIFIVLPNMLLLQEVQSSPEKCKLSNDFNMCLDTEADKKQEKFYALDIVQGSGLLQYSLMFYGAYSNKLIERSWNEEIQFLNSTTDLIEKDLKRSKPLFYYNMPLAYIFVTVSYFFIVLVAIVRAAAREFKDRLINGKWQFYQYCNLVFGGWDFCIHNEKSAAIKHKAIHNEVKSILHVKRIEIERSSRSTDLMYKLILIRIVINTVVLSILIVSALLIYYLFNISLLHQYEEEILEKNPFNSSYNDAETFTEVNIAPNQFIEKFNSIEEKIINLFFDFIPFIAIVALNLFVPIIFNYLCTFEKYSPLFVVKISLFRKIFLRLASLGVLLSRFYYIVEPPQNSHKNSNVQRQCWETFVGQQFYKLVITDFFCHLLVTFCINFPRALCARSFSHNIIRLMGEQEFDLPKHVLDVVYIQTICWLSSFYCPLMPGIVAIIIFLMFYLKKFQCLVNSKPSQIFYGASRTNSLFMFILLLSFFAALVPLTYAIAEIKPSLICGPFKGLTTVWSAPIAAFMNMPAVVKNVIFFFGTAAFAIPCFVILTLLLYYFYAVSDANKNMVEVLKNQLILEGHDKQFLLTRLGVFLKQQQEVHPSNVGSEVLN